MGRPIVPWYRDGLGMTVLSPPHVMVGPDIERDMGEMILRGVDEGRHRGGSTDRPGAGADRVPAAPIEATLSEG